ncbi:hypothetical protein C7120_07295 [Prevotella sp. oral taxon 376]|nr:hypothetical protein C7120_07295 [Prevotella sp. oral taxon 376]
MKKLVKWAVPCALVAAVIAGIRMAGDAERSGISWPAERRPAADALPPGKVPLSEGSHHCLSVRQMLYVAELVKLEGGKVAGLKDERTLDRLMVGMGYRKERYDFEDQDGEVMAYAYDCELDQTGSMVRTRSTDANRVIVACGHQPESSNLVTLVVAGRAAYNELLMQIYDMNYYKGADGAFHKEGSRFRIFPSELVDGHGFEVDICRE